MNRRRGLVLKSERELRLMRQAGKVNARALLESVSIIEPGITTADIEAAAAGVLKEYGAKPAFLGVPGAYPYPAVTTVCVNDELVHAIPGSRKLIEGDIVSIDCGSIVEGFVGDSALTVPVGEISEQAQRLIEVTRGALFAGIDQMRMGNHTGDVSAAIQELVEAEGFNVVREYTGHGIGREMHEEPQVPNFGQPGTGPVLRKGMTLALEPMLNAGVWCTWVGDDHWTVFTNDGSLSAHFEHTIAITDAEPEVLTTA